MDEITVASLNIHHGESGRIGATFHELCDQGLSIPDVIFLQEVRGKHVGKLAEEFSNVFGLPHFAFAAEPNFPVPNIGHGLVTLSRYPLSAHKVVLLASVKRRFHAFRQRIALVSEMKFGQESITLVNLHLEPRLISRKLIGEFQPILEWFDISQATRAVVGGDFNTISPLAVEAVKKELSSRGFKTPFGNTSTMNYFPLKLDWLFFRGMVIREYGVSRFFSSDHRVIWAKAVL